VRRPGYPGGARAPSGHSVGGDCGAIRARCARIFAMTVDSSMGVRGILPIAETLDHVGPLCRTALDCAPVLDAIAGEGPLDAVSIRAEAACYSQASSAQTTALRLGMPRGFFYDDLDVEIAAAVEEALTQLTRLTAWCQDVTWPPTPHSALSRRGLRQPRAVPRRFGQPRPLPSGHARATRGGERLSRQRLHRRATGPLSGPQRDREPLRASRLAQQRRAVQPVWHPDDLDPARLHARRLSALCRLERGGPISM